MMPNPLVEQKIRSVSISALPKARMVGYMKLNSWQGQRLFSSPPYPVCLWDLSELLYIGHQEFFHRDNVARV
jgi:hypothetical protein